MFNNPFASLTCEELEQAVLDPSTASMLMNEQWEDAYFKASDPYQNGEEEYRLILDIRRVGPKIIRSPKSVLTDLYKILQDAPSIRSLRLTFQGVTLRYYEEGKETLYSSVTGEPIKLLFWDHIRLRPGMLCEEHCLLQSIDLATKTYYTRSDQYGNPPERKVLQAFAEQYVPHQFNRGGLS